MGAPQNTDFSQQGPVVGTAAGWVTNIVNTAVSIADYRGTRPAPLGHEDFSSDWGNNQAWDAVIGAAKTALFDKPTIAVGNAFESFGINWSNFPAMRATGGGPNTWKAPATGVCNVYLLTDVLETPVSYTAASPAAVSPLTDPAPRTYEGFDVAWAKAPGVVSVSSITTGNPVVVNLSANHGYAVGQVFSVYLRGLDGHWGLNGLWLNATATSLTSFSLPVSCLSSFSTAASFAYLETAFETRLRPPAWASLTSYHAGALVLSNGNWYQAASLASTTWARSAPYTVGQIVSAASGNYYQVASVSNSQAAPTSAVISSVTVSSTIQGSNSTSITTGTPHGLATGQYAYISAAQGSTNINGVWKVTVTGPSTFTIPIGNTIPYLGGGTVLGPVGVSASSGNGPTGTGLFTDNAGPSQITWAFVSATSGTSGLIAPMGTTNFVDGGVNWNYVRKAPASSLSASTSVSYADATVAVASNGVNIATFAGAGTLNVDSTSGWPSSGQLTLPTHGGAAISYTSITSTAFNGCTLVSGSGVLSTGDSVAGPFEAFQSASWKTVPYPLTIASSSTANYHGWDVPSPATPAFVANPAEVVEAFTQIVPTPIIIALVDTTNNGVVLAPGKTLVDGARVMFNATPPFAAFGSTYPSPLVPGVSYFLWKNFGTNGMAVGLTTIAQTTPIQSSTNAANSTITTTAPHGLNVNDYVLVFDHLVDTVIAGVHKVVGLSSSTIFTIDAGGGPAGGATGFVYGPIQRVAITTTGGAQLTVSLDPAWDWATPG